MPLFDFLGPSAPARACLARVCFDVARRVRRQRVEPRRVRADTAVHVEPGPGEPGGSCGASVACATGTERASTRCVSCGALGQRPCATGCREGAPRYGVCFDQTVPGGTLGGICVLEDCDPCTCTVPDGTNFVCFACGQGRGQPCCPILGCQGALTCTDDVCH